MKSPITIVLMVVLVAGSLSASDLRLYTSPGSGLYQVDPYVGRCELPRHTACDTIHCVSSMAASALDLGSLAGDISITVGSILGQA